MNTYAIVLELPIKGVEESGGLGLGGVVGYYENKKYFNKEI